MNRLARVIFAAALLLSPTFARAQGTSLGWGQKNQQPQSATSPRVPQVKVWITGGVSAADTSGVPLQFDASGNLRTVDNDRDRDFPLLTGSGISSINLNAGNTVRVLTAAAPFLGQYSRNSLMLTWGTATAADSDSVNIVVRLYGATSLSSGNMYLWTPQAFNTSASDTCFTSGTSSAAAGGNTCIKPSPTFYITRNTLTDLSTTGAIQSIRKIPGWAYRSGASTTGIMVPLTDASGAVCPYPYLVLELTNVHPRKNLTSVTAYYWPRVN